MSTTTATATIEVPCDPGTAFNIFTADIGTWWKCGTHYWNDADRGLEPRVGGRLVGLARWESPEAFAASAEKIFGAVADDPLDLWLEQPPDIFHLTQP